MITPAKLDEIATKLLGWTPTRCPIHGTSCPEAYYHKPDGTQGHGFLDVESPAAAMLVLEAMGRWCIENEYLVLLTHRTKWRCCIEHATEKEVRTEADTPAGAIFACAAQLVERM